MFIRIFRKDDTQAVVTLPYAGKVKILSWTEYGGYDRAILEYPAINKYDYWDFIDLLRNPVAIYGDAGEVIWIGYVHEVVLDIEGVTSGISLDSMANSIAVIYSRVAVGTSTVGERATTSYATDTVSIGEYGTKQLLKSAGGMSDTAATDLRDQLLKYKKFPIPITKFRKPATNKVTLNCRGWFYTLDWKIYNNSSTTQASYTSQIATIVSTCGQFLNGTENFSTASAINSSQYKNDNKTGYDEIKALAAERYVITTTPEKKVRISDKLNKSLLFSPYVLKSDGTLIQESGATIPRYAPPVAVYARLYDFIVNSFVSTKIADPSVVYITDTEYNVERDEIRYTFKDMSKAGDVGGVF